MKYLVVFLCLCGCVQKKLPPNYDPARFADDKPVVIEINKVPAPFDINGLNPYILWINGEKVDMPKEELLLLVEKAGKRGSKGVEVSDVHEGWLWPHKSKRVDPSKAMGRVRIVSPK